MTDESEEVYFHQNALHELDFASLESLQASLAVVGLSLLGLTALGLGMLKSGYKLRG